jgi:hypothetical protein
VLATGCVEAGEVRAVVETTIMIRSGRPIEAAIAVSGGLSGNAATPVTIRWLGPEPDADVGAEVDHLTFNLLQTPGHRLVPLNRRSTPATWPA